MQSIVMLSVKYKPYVLSVIILNFVMLNVVAPKKRVYRIGTCLMIKSLNAAVTAAGSLEIWSHCYKAFFLCHWWQGLIRWRVCPWKPFPVRSYNLRARPEPTQLEHFPDASFLGKLLVLPVNVRPDWKGTNTLAYFAWSSATKETSFIILRPGWDWVWGSIPGNVWRWRDVLPPALRPSRLYRAQDPAHPGPQEPQVLRSQGWTRGGPRLWHQGGYLWDSHLKIHWHSRLKQADFEVARILKFGSDVR